MNTINTDTKIDDRQDALAAMLGCIPILEKIADQSELLAFLPEPERIALITAAGKISRPDRKEIKKRNKDSYVVGLVLLSVFSTSKRNKFQIYIL